MEASPPPRRLMAVAFTGVARQRRSPGALPMGRSACPARVLGKAAPSPAAARRESVL